MVAIDNDKHKQVDASGEVGIGRRVSTKFNDVMFRLRAFVVHLRRSQRNRRRGISEPTTKIIERRQFQRRECSDRRGEVRWDETEQTRRKLYGRRQADEIWRIDAKMRSMIAVEDIKYLD